MSGSRARLPTIYFVGINVHESGWFGHPHLFTSTLWRSAVTAFYRDEQSSRVRLSQDLADSHTSSKLRSVLFSPDATDAEAADYVLRPQP